MKANMKGIFKETLHSIFPTAIPSHVEWEDCNDIVSILKSVGSTSNHMFFPDGGGLDLNSASSSAENGCIELEAGLNIIVKPKKLIFESFTDFDFNYFRLELSELELIGKNVDDSIVSEELYKISNEGYIPREQCDCGECFDEITLSTAQLVKRYKSGAFVIFSKDSLYNQVSSTYDARHNKMTSEQFRLYIEDVISHKFSL